MNIRNLTFPCHGTLLTADLSMPACAKGLVIFAHGSGSSRNSPRNRQVAQALEEAGLATLLCDLLTLEEESHDRTGIYRFDIQLLAERLRAASRWARKQAATRNLPVGFFGASTGAAAALVAAALSNSAVRAVVSRGGRPDLAGPGPLAAVTAPTLLIVGDQDPVVLDLNRQAARQLRCPHELVTVPGATHLFEEPGALEQVARLATDWFLQHLAPTTVEAK